MLSEPPAPVSPQAVIQLLCGRKGPQSPDQTKQTNKQNYQKWIEQNYQKWNETACLWRTKSIYYYCTPYHTVLQLIKISLIEIENCPNNFVIILYKYYYIPIHFFVWKRLSSIYPLMSFIPISGLFCTFPWKCNKEISSHSIKTLNYSQFSIKQGGWVKRAGLKT